MKKELAKKQGLNWQALLIEETQTEIKTTVQRMVLAQRNFADINKKIVEIVNSLVEELESKDLKQTCRDTLFAFATRVYNYLQRTYQGVGLSGVYAILSVANGVGTVEQIRKTNEIISKIVPDYAYRVGVPLDVYAKEYMQNVEDRLNKLVKVEPKEDYTSRVNLRNIAEMQVRQENHIKDIDKLVGKGVKLVWIQPHANCSKRCEPWQDRLYSLDKTSGTIDGIAYEPLENATNIYETTKSGKIYKNGCISGFNCRHTLVPYEKGNEPIEIPARVIDRQREVNNKQRYLERGVREWKERALLHRYSEKEYRFAKSKAIEWNKRYIEYSKKNNVAYYDSRTKVL